MLFVSLLNDIISIQIFSYNWIYFRLASAASQKELNDDVNDDDGSTVEHDIVASSKMVPQMISVVCHWFVCGSEASEMDLNLFVISAVHAAWMTCRVKRNHRHNLNEIKCFKFRFSMWMCLWCCCRCCCWRKLGWVTLILQINRHRNLLADCNFISRKIIWMWHRRRLNNIQPSLL